MKYEQLEVSTRPEERTSNLFNLCTNCCTIDICSPFFILSWFFAVICIGVGSIYSLLDGDEDFLRETGFVPSILFSLLCFFLSIQKYRLSRMMTDMKIMVERQPDLIAKRNATARQLYLAKEANALLSAEHGRHLEEKKQNDRKRKRLHPKLQALQVKYARIKDKARISRKRFVINLKEATELHSVVMYLKAESEDLNDLRTGILPYLEDDETITDFVRGANIFFEDSKMRKIDSDLRELALRLETRRVSQVGFTRKNFQIFMERLPLEHWKSRIHFEDYVEDGILPWYEMSNIIKEILTEIDPPHTASGVYMPDLLRVKSLGKHQRSYSPWAGALDFSSIGSIRGIKTRSRRYRSTDSGTYSLSSDGSWGGGNFDLPSSVDSLGKLSFGSSVGAKSLRSRSASSFSHDSDNDFDFADAQKHLRMIETLMWDSTDEISDQLLIAPKNRQHNPFDSISLSVDRPHSTINTPRSSIRAYRSDSGFSYPSTPGRRSNENLRSKSRSSQDYDLPTQHTPSDAFLDSASPFHSRQNSRSLYDLHPKKRIPSLNTLLNISQLKSESSGRIRLVDAESPHRQPLPDDFWHDAGDGSGTPI